MPVGKTSQKLTDETSALRYKWNKEEFDKCWNEKSRSQVYDHYVSVVGLETNLLQEACANYSLPLRPVLLSTIFDYVSNSCCYFVKKRLHISSFYAVW